MKLVTEAGTDTQLLALRQYLSGNGGALRWGGTVRFSVALPLPLTPPAVWKIFPYCAGEGSASILGST